MRVIIIARVHAHATAAVHTEEWMYRVGAQEFSWRLYGAAQCTHIHDTYKQHVHITSEHVGIRRKPRMYIYSHAFVGSIAVSVLLVASGQAAG